MNVRSNMAGETYKNTTILLLIKVGAEVLLPRVVQQKPLTLLPIALVIPAFTFRHDYPNFCLSLRAQFRTTRNRHTAVSGADTSSFLEIMEIHNRTHPLPESGQGTPILDSDRGTHPILFPERPSCCRCRNVGISLSFSGKTQGTRC